MKKFGSWTEQVSSKFRTSTDNKEVTIIPPATLAGASNSFTTPNITGTTDTVLSRVSVDQTTNRLQNKDLAANTVGFVDNTDTSKKLLLNLAGFTTATTRTITIPNLSDTLVTETHTQALSNKTIDGDLNTVQDLALTSLKTTGNLNVFLQRNGSGVVIDSAKTVPAGDVVGTSDTQALTGKTIDADLNTLSNIENADIKAAAGIVYSKLSLANSIVNADINTAAAIAYSKLNLSGAIVNADINTAAAIAYSKLNLANSIVNADVATAAAIARSKLASGSNDHVVINSGTGVMTSEAQLSISRGGTGQATATLGFNALSPLTTKGDLVAHDGTNNVRHAVGADGQVLTANSANATGLGWSSPLTNPMDSEGDLIVGGVGGAATKLDSGTAEYVLQANGAAAPSWVNTLAMGAGAVGTPSYSFTTDLNTGLWSSGADTVNLSTGGVERLRVNSAGELLHGITTARTFAGGSSTAKVEIESITNARQLSTFFNGNNSTASIFTLGKSRGTTVGSNTIVQSGDALGIVGFEGTDGVQSQTAAFIAGIVDGTPGVNDMPGRLAFYTTPDGSSSASERMRIDNAGNVGVGGMAPSSLFHMRKNQNAQTTLFVENTDVTNTSSRATLNLTGGTVVGIATSIATDGFFVGSSSAHTLYLGTTGQTRGSITSGGLWTIGSSAVAAAHVIQSNQTNPLNVSNVNSDTNSYLSFSTSTTGVRGYIGAGNAGALVVLNAAGSTTRFSVSDTGACVLGTSGGTSSHTAYGNSLLLSGTVNPTISLVGTTNVGQWNIVNRSDSSGAPLNINQGGNVLMHANSSGQFGFNVNAVSPSYDFHVQKNANNSQVFRFENLNTTNSSTRSTFDVNAGSTRAFWETIHGSSSGIGTISAHTFTIFTNSTTRASISSAGALSYTGTADFTASESNPAYGFTNNVATASSNTRILQLRFTGDTDVTGGYFLTLANNSGTVIGRIEAASNTTTSFTGSSDQRLKQNPSTFDGLALIGQMIPREFEWVSNPTRRDKGFYAQELHTVYPEAVSVGSDELTEDEQLINPWGIDYGKLTPVLVKAVQELKAQLDAALARIEQLENP